MWGVFQKWDRASHGKIDLNDYWEGILDEERTSLGDEILKLLNIDEDEQIDFGQFALITTTYCLFEVHEVLQVCSQSHTSHPCHRLSAVPARVVNPASPLPQVLLLHLR